MGTVPLLEEGIPAQEIAQASFSTNGVHETRTGVERESEATALKREKETIALIEEVRIYLENLLAGKVENLDGAPPATAIRMALHLRRYFVTTNNTHAEVIAAVGIILHSLTGIDEPHQKFLETRGELEAELRTRAQKPKPAATSLDSALL